MPKYTVITKTTTEREYEVPVELPYDMGDSTERLCDRMMRAQAEKGSFVPDETTKIHKIGGDDESEEEVIAIYREDKQIWPRPRKIKVATKASQIKFNDKHIFSEENMPDPLTED